MAEPAQFVLPAISEYAMKAKFYIEMSLFSQLGPDTVKKDWQIYQWRNPMMMRTTYTITHLTSGVSHDIYLEDYDKKILGDTKVGIKLQESVRMAVLEIKKHEAELTEKVQWGSDIFDIYLPAGCKLVTGTLAQTLMKATLTHTETGVFDVRKITIPPFNPDTHENRQRAVQEGVKVMWDNIRWVLREDYGMAV